MTFYADHIIALDTQTPDKIIDASVGYFTVRLQQHDDVYHVCMMTWEGDRIGPWITTNDADAADNHVAFLELQAMIDSGKA